ncbi:Dihydrodipicolinate synthase [Gossypium arboreum]|uniref:Dihydrodipicolinate synthase n=1 Tax=Gossypium arboreum TaxID=29729 RepID=A0A0B0N4N7_GOSAR|nr:Dihydrodipicolinate synthase [Gossypium arboreum]
MPRRRMRDLSIVQISPNSEETNSDQWTAIGSSNVPNAVDKLVEIQIENDGRRKTRVHTLLKDLYNLNFVERVKVSRNSHGQPIGIEALVLVGYLGIITQNANLLPIKYESWHHMYDSNKNHALDNIKERSTLEVSDNYVKKDREQVGTKSMQKQKFTHIVGSKSFACIADDEELSFGQKVRRLQLFDITHRKKDGYPMTTEAVEIMEKLKDKRVEYEAIASSNSSVNLDDIDN